MDTQSDTDYCFGECVKCRKAVRGIGQACRALGQLYHDDCFTCCNCSRKLRGSPFYYMSEQVFCEEHFLHSRLKCSVDVCDSCGFLITDMAVQAVGKSFHPTCFRCVVCNQRLEGEPFSVDTQSRIYCVKDFQRRGRSPAHSIGQLIWRDRSLAPSCEACGLLILPSEGSVETIQVVSMDRNYHVECFPCNFGERSIKNT
ncbi:LIM domain-containing protein 1 [Colossoma macropomum]|uniref:LIM domain-containing protein 1 n=1 Tax=Colossoma macropomum TaxID=42526 RepID=UPI001864B2ED|nr:LIM domain-containing protein 1 [Colossoma macropomum]